MKLRLTLSGSIEVNIDCVDDQGNLVPDAQMPLSFGSPAPAPGQPAVTPQSAIGQAVDEQIAAAITSAVAMALRGRRFRIQKIQMVSGAPQWGQIGRQSIHASHAIERKSR